MDENVRNINYEIKIPKAIEQQLGLEFNRIDPDEKVFDIFKAINETFKYIKLSSLRYIK